MTSEQQLAAFAVSLIERAPAQCDDVTQQNVATAKSWLRALRDGVIVTIPAVELKKLKETPAAVDKTIDKLRAEKASRARAQAESLEREVKSLVDVSEAMEVKLGG